MSKADLTPARLRELLHYDAETGVLIWRVDRGQAGAKAGDRAGHVTSDGYLRVTLAGFRHLAHRLVWLYVYGVWPQHRVDHLNGNPQDNRIANLRDVPVKTNNENRRRPHRNNKSGFLGVSPKADKWVAKIRVGGVLRHLGYFVDPEQAHQVYVEAKRRLHEGCTL